MLIDESLFTESFDLGGAVLHLYEIWERRFFANNHRYLSLVFVEQRFGNDLRMACNQI